MKDGLKYALWFIVIIIFFKTCEACVGCANEADRTFKRIDKWQEERQKRENEIKERERINSQIHLASIARAIDLGLPSGTLWAEWNLGATKPEGYGEYFAWGETTGTNEGKRTYAWSTYKLCDGGNPDLISKYRNIFDKDILEPEDDAAYINWGDGWIIPSSTQFYELMRHCIWKPSTRNGVKGYLISSKSNSNSIFLPMSGYIDNDNLYSRNTRGYYWTNKLNYALFVGTGKPDCLILEEDETTISCSRVERYEGISIRPVYTQRVDVKEITEEDYEEDYEGDYDCEEETENTNTIEHTTDEQDINIDDEEYDEISEEIEQIEQISQ